MRFSTPIKLVMFDFDGTLVDTAPDIISTTNLLLQKNGKTKLPDETIRAEIGTGLITLLSDIFPESKDDAFYRKKLETEFLEIYQDQMLESPKPYPGVLEFLTQIAPANGLKIAIVSNKRQEMIHRILSHLKLDELPWVDIVGGDTLQTMKPHPAPMQRAMSRAQTSGQESVIVGDGTPDIEGALASGCFSIAVDFGYGAISELMDLGAHGKISHYSMLPKALEALPRT